MMVTRHKPSNKARAATHTASELDYQKLGQAVVEAIIKRERDIILKLPYFVTIEQGFPKGIIVHKDDKCNWYRAKCFKLADFLHKKGILPYDAKGIMLSIRQMSYLEGKIDKLLAEPQETMYNDVSVDDEGRSR